MAVVARLAICSCGPPNRASFPKKKIFEDAITLSFMQEEKWKYSRRFSRGTTHEFGRVYAAFTNLNDAEFMQYRSPVGRGPSSNTCPKCASHSLQATAIRVMPMVLSLISRTFSLAIGSQKLGQPVPESNFVAELNSALSQQMQR